MVAEQFPASVALAPAIASAVIRFSGCQLYKVVFHLFLEKCQYMMVL
jgi:hypothetical protein